MSSVQILSCLDQYQKYDISFPNKVNAGVCHVRVKFKLFDGILYTWVEPLNGAVCLKRTFLKSFTDITRYPIDDQIQEKEESRTILTHETSKCE